MAFLGLRDTGDFATDQVPEDWDKGISLLFPNGSPVTTVMGMLGSKPAGYKRFHWWEKDGLAIQRVFATDSKLSTDTALTVEDEDGAAAAFHLTNGVILLHETSGEYIIINVPPTVTTTISVSRDLEGTGASAVTAGDAFSIITNAYEEGSKSPSAVSENPTEINNFTQIFKKSLYETRTALQTETRTDANGNYDELLRETLNRIAMEMELAYLRGIATSGSGPLGNPRTTTGGILSFIPAANRQDITDHTGSSLNTNISISIMEDILEQVFRFGSDERLVICGGFFLKAINQLVRSSSQFNDRDSKKTFGMNVRTWESPFGIVHFKVHSLMRNHGLHRNDAIFLDMSDQGDMSIRERVIQPMDLKQNRQDNDEDARMDFFLAEKGVQVPQAVRHYELTGTTGFQP